MNYNLIFLINVLGLLRYQVIGLPLISTIFKGLPRDVNNHLEKGQVVSNKLDEFHDPDVIDLSQYGRFLYGKPDVKKTGSLVAKLKKNETSVNAEELGSYLEGDILMPENTVILKNGLNLRALRWPNGEVPFEIADDFDMNDLNVISYALNEYHAKTCIRFKPRTSEKDYISLVKGNSGCWSGIGRMGGKQQLNLQTPGCLMKPGTAIHELMHVLGFMHEQNRKERDSFVSIQMQNVEKYAVPNFRKEANTFAFGVSYDYGSVMHYSPTAFSSNGLPTIIAKKPIDIRIMGQRDGFSPMDIVKVNRMYNCEMNRKPVAPPVKLQKRLPPQIPPATQNYGQVIGIFFNRFIRIW